MNNSAEDSPAVIRFDKFGAWCGPLYGLFALIGWWLLAGYWPLHTPTDSPEKIAGFYSSDNVLSLRVGLIVMMWAAVLLLFFTSTTSSYISKIEGRSGTLTFGMLLGGFASAMLTFYPCLWWLTAAFRGDSRPQDITFLLNDVGWLQLVGGVSLVITMYSSVAIAALIDKRPQPTFPRWSGFFSLWVLVLFFPGQLLFLFKTGPFAWNGLLAFWVPGTLFFGWFVVIGILLLKAINREQASE
jgi:hypothetical protein